MAAPVGRSGWPLCGRVAQEELPAGSQPRRGRGHGAGGPRRRRRRGSGHRRSGRGARARMRSTTTSAFSREAGTGLSSGIWCETIWDKLPALEGSTMSPFWRSRAATTRASWRMWRYSPCASALVRPLSRRTIPITFDFVQWALIRGFRKRLRGIQPGHPISALVAVRYA